MTGSLTDDPSFSGLSPPLSVMITPLFFLFFLVGLAAPYAFVAQIVNSVWEIGSRVAAGE